MTDDSKDFIKIRSFLADNVEILLENLNVRRQAGKIDSEDLFGETEEVNSSIPWKKDFKTRSLLEVLVAEKESLGLYVSGNPLQNYKEILEWIREITNEDEIHLVLINKAKKVFTRTNAMMFALDISTIGENYEGIIFPKNAIELSPILEEKELFWVRGRVVKNKKKKKEVEAVEGEIQEYNELPKLAIEGISKFEEGLNRLFASSEIKLAVNRQKALDSVNWEGLKNDPKNLEQYLKKDPKPKPDKEDSQKAKIIEIPKTFGPSKLKNIKAILKKEPDNKDSIKIKLKIQHNGDWKMARGSFWVNENELNKILKS